MTELLPYFSFAWGRRRMERKTKQMSSLERFEEDAEEGDKDANNKTIRKIEELRDELVMLGRDLEDLKERTGFGMNEILKTLDTLIVAVEELEEKIEHLETRFQNFLDNFPYILPP